MNVKGSALSARVQYVRDQGVPQYARLLNELSAPTRVAVEAGFDADRWYPFAMFVELSEVIDRQLGAGDLGLCVELGRYACDTNLTTLYRFLFKVGNIHFLIRRAAAAWHIHYDEGAMHVLEETPRSVRFAVEGIQQPHRAHCLSVKGWMTEAARISGRHIVDVSETCRLLGDERCTFGMAWE